LELLEGEREEIIKQVGEVMEKYQSDREKLLPVLQEVQGRLGYLPLLAMEKVAEAMDIPTVDVYGMTTFYNQFRLNPPGEHEIKVCMGTACYMVGGQIAMDSFERRLEINEGETTADRKYSLERVACVGCCTLAPVVVVNEMVEGHVTPTRVDGLLLSLDGEQKEGAAEAGTADEPSSDEQPVEAEGKHDREGEQSK